MSKKKREKNNTQRNIIKMNEQGVIFIPKSWNWDTDFVRIEDLLESFKYEPLLNYNEETGEFELHFEDLIYIIEIPESIKNDINNKYIKFLMDKVKEGKYVAKLVADRGSYPTDEKEIELYYNYLEKNYKDSKAIVTKTGVTTAISALSATAGVGYLVYALNSYEVNLILFISAITACAVGTCYALSIGGHIPAEVKEMSKKKDLLNRFKEYLKSRMVKTDKVKQSPKCDDSLLLSINELIETIRSIEDKETRDKYSERVKKLSEQYRDDIKKIVEKYGIGTEGFALAYKELIKNYQSEIIVLHAQIANSTEITKNEEPQVASFGM